MLTDLLVKNASSDRLYVEDVFSTWLYTGSGIGQTISNGIDLAGKGGLIWEKRRNATDNHYLTDTARGGTKYLISNLTNANNAGTTTLYNFLSNGYSTSNSWAWANGATVASWTFRKAPKFFDVVTYTGNGTARTISHNLGSVPGMIIVKSTSQLDNWKVYHRSLTSNAYYILLDSTAAQSNAVDLWNSTTPTATTFSIGSSGNINTNGASYVAYLFAHDTSTDGIVQCGSYTGNGSTTGPTITLGWEPQFLLVKGATEASANWFMFDTMRGLPVDSSGASLVANSANAEGTSLRFTITPTGFYPVNNQSQSNASGQTYIYLAIRRGPMRTPTDATKVFTPLTRTGTSAAATVSAGFAPDAVYSMGRTGSFTNGNAWWDRIRGSLLALRTTAINLPTSSTNSVTAYTNTGVTLGADGSNAWINYSPTSYVNYFLGRAPGFFDTVCYTGTGSNRTVSHNLGVVPEMVIVKTTTVNTGNWFVYNSSLGNTKRLLLETTGAASVDSTAWNNTSPTSSAFSVGTNVYVNGSGYGLIAYLFATCPGVSKVGSYTGTGTTQQINCGFTNGARFVLIKRTDSTGDWYVWDSARGIIAGNDPYLLLNVDQNTEVTNTDYVDAYSAGFELSSTAPAALNANGGTYIYLAIA